MIGLMYDLPSEHTSNRMKKVKSKGTSLEGTMEKILKELNIKYKKQLTHLSGRPDFRIKGTNILLFCDSSFWHGRRKSELDGTAFKKNKEFWTKKLLRNKKRDERNNRILRKNGWSVHRFWDTDIFKKPEKVKKRILKIINEKKEK